MNERVQRLRMQKRGESEGRTCEGLREGRACVEWNEIVEKGKLTVVKSVKKYL